MRQVCVLGMLLATLTGAKLAAARTERTYTDGLILDAGEYDWCHHDCAPFDRTTFFFCVQAGKQVLVGSRKADWRWQRDSFAMLPARGKPISVRYNQESFWILRADGREFHVTRDYSQDVFTNAKCTAEVHQHWLIDLAHVRRPLTVPAQAAIVPQGPHSLFDRTGPYFWVRCTFNPGSRWDLCDSWDKKGSKLTELQCVNSTTHEAVVQKDLVVDPLTTKVDYEIHLRDGTVLRDWAKGRINEEPIPGSVLPKAIHNRTLTRTYPPAYFFVSPVRELTTAKLPLGVAVSSM